jgi:hypothetical protein
MTSAQPTSRKPTRWSCYHTHDVIVNIIHAVSTAKRKQTRHMNTRATGVQKRPDRNRERGTTRHSNRGAAHKLTPHTREYINHIHMCTENSDNSERLQCRRAYWVLSGDLFWFRFVCYHSEAAHTISAQHYTLLSDMNVAVDNLIHIANEATPPALYGHHAYRSTFAFISHGECYARHVARGADFVNVRDLLSCHESVGGCHCSELEHTRTCWDTALHAVCTKGPCPKCDTRARSSRRFEAVQHQLTSSCSLFITDAVQLQTDGTTLSQSKDETICRYGKRKLLPVVR